MTVANLVMNLHAKDRASAQLRATEFRVRTEAVLQAARGRQRLLPRPSSPSPK